MHKWYVVHVLSTHEKKVKKTLEDNRQAQGLESIISEIVLPIEKVMEVKGGEQKVAEKRLWPGYLLLKMELTEESWSYVNGASGVIGFLGGEHPSELTDEEVQVILDDLTEKKETIQPRHSFATGDYVKIVDGVFVNFIGQVLEVNYEKGTINLEVSIFGRDTRVDDLEFWQVEEASDEDIHEAGLKG